MIVITVPARLRDGVRGIDKRPELVRRTLSVYLSMLSMRLHLGTFYAFARGSLQAGRYVTTGARNSSVRVYALREMLRGHPCHLTVFIVQMALRKSWYTYQGCQVFAFTCRFTVTWNWKLGNAGWHKRLTFNSNSFWMNFEFILNSFWMNFEFIELFCSKHGANSMKWRSSSVLVCTQIGLQIFAIRWSPPWYLWKGLPDCASFDFNCSLYASQPGCCGFEVLWRRKLMTFRCARYGQSN